jgi:hypothetical protein
MNMKQNRLLRLLAAGAVSAIAVSTAFAQESTTSTTTTADGKTVASTTTAKTIDGTGTITAYKSGLDYVMIRTESTTAPIMYYYDKSTTIVDSEGKKVEWAMIKPDMAVKYTYATEGDRLMVRKITLQKPLSHDEKTARKKP